MWHVDKSANISPHERVVVESETPLVRLLYRDEDHACHWRRPGSQHRGIGWVEFTGHQAAGWVSIITDESYTPAAGASWVSKRTMLSLPRGAVKELRDMLNRVLDGDAHE